MRAPRIALSLWVLAVAGFGAVAPGQATDDGRVVVVGAAVVAALGAAAALVGDVRHRRWVTVVGLLVSMVVPIGYGYPILLVPLALLAWTLLGRRPGGRPPGVVVGAEGLEPPTPSL